MEKQRNIIKKLKNIILKAITFIAVMVWVVSGCCLDSENWTPFLIGMLVSSLWILVFSIANSRK